MLTYDNIDDTKTKLLGTYLYFQGKVAYVKDVKHSLKSYLLHLHTQDPNGKMKNVELTSPELNYTHYNLGYANYKDETVWWCKVPLKQYQQGLRNQQLKYIRSGPPNYDLMPNIDMTAPTINMLENNYPSLELICDGLRMSSYKSRAFHKDFGLSWDPVHKDFILQCKGRNVGHFKDKNDIQFMNEFEFLNEIVKEVIT